MFDIVISAAAVFFTFGLVIFLHEFGHFLVCKKLGVRVERFAFGFGPELVGTTYGDTRFSICAIPLGGFVKPAGESIEDATGHEDEYFSRSPWQRLAIVAAGPAMNYALAFFVFFGVIYFRGQPEPSTEAVIGYAEPSFPAAQAGLKIGDRVLRVDGVDIGKWSDMATIIHSRGDKTVRLTFSRDGNVSDVELTPRLDSGSGRGLIGIMPEEKFRRVGLLEAARDGAYLCWYWTKYTVTTLAENIYRRQRPDLAGPVGIVQMVSRAAHSGLADLFRLIGLLSVAIGFFNILPIPLLDGGHAMLYLYEGLSRKKLTVQIVSYANSAGLVFLLSLLAFATYNDFLRIWTQRQARKAPAEEAAPSSDKAPNSVPVPAPAPN